MGRSSSNSLAPGFRFHPTDEELVRYYLRRKVVGKSVRFDPIAVIDIYKSEPWDLPCQSKLKTRDLEWYFFSALDKKYGNGSKTNRATEKGYWKTTGKDRQVKHNTRVVGMKKTLVYHSGRAPRGERTNWVMHEYRLDDEELVKSEIPQDAFVLCRVFQKSGSGPKNGEQYGAPFVEEEWEEDDDEVAPPVPDEGAVSDEMLFGDDIGAFLETDDLEQNLDMVVATESAPLPPNFYIGESSSYPEHSQEFTEDQKPLVSPVEASGTLEEQFPNMPEQYAMDNQTLKNEYNGEASPNGNPSSFTDPIGELYLDAIDFAPVGDGSFLETNDLANPIDFDPAGIDMLEEYLYLDAEDDISKYLSFDSPEFTSGEDFVPDQAQPIFEQNVDKETKGSSMASKQDFEAPCDDGASSSKQNPEVPKSASGITNPFIKHATNLLGSIPAPPAFASEFPPNGIALQLHAAAQSSNADHITAGMIRVTNVTIRGNGMDWMLGKNGEFNFVISSDFSQPHVNNSAALAPASGLLTGKTAFMVSHCWVFVMLFSVLILSLSCKIGSFMYAGK